MPGQSKLQAVTASLSRIKQLNKMTNKVEEDKTLIMHEITDVHADILHQLQDTKNARQTRQTRGILPSANS